MTTKTKIICAIIGFVASFAFGRYLAPTKIKIEEHTVTVDKSKDSKSVDTDINKHKETVVKEIVRPDGTKETTTTVTEDTVASRDSKEKSSSDKSTDKTTSKEITRSTGRLNISALASVDTTQPSTPTYGVAVTRDVIGPISIGVFGFTNKTFGASLGLSF